MPRLSVSTLFSYSLASARIDLFHYTYFFLCCLFSRLLFARKPGIDLTVVKLTLVKSQADKALTKATGDVLKAIYALQDVPETGGVALPSDIAIRTGTSRAFVTKMLKTMSGGGLVNYAPYRGVRLTATGAQSAIELSRHHRLLERFLTDCLGFPPDAAHEEAERLEHVISEEFETRLDAFLGYPSTCPHGTPIPRPDGTLPQQESNL